MMITRSVGKEGSVDHSSFPVILWADIFKIICLRFLVTHVGCWCFISPVVRLSVVSNVIEVLLQSNPTMTVDRAGSMERLRLIIFHPIQSSLLVGMLICFSVPSGLIPKL